MKSKTIVLLLLAVALFAVGGLAASDKLTYLFYGEPGEADPAKGYSLRCAVIHENCYDRLLTYEGEDASKFAPQLAKEWEVSDDATVITFKLREDAVFHNGDPVTAEAVRYSFNRAMTMNQEPAWLLKMILDFDSVKVIDDHTVEIHLTFPYVAALGVLTHTVASIVNPAVVEANGGVVADTENLWMNQNVGGAGSGAYILKEWIPAERLVFERFDDYWGEKGKIKTIECPIVLEAATRVMLLRAGDADVHPYFEQANLPELEGAENLILMPDPGFTLDFVALGCRGPLADKAVRKAISYAYPYEDVIEYVYNGYATRSTGAIPRGMFGYYAIPEEQRYRHDLEKANQLLDEAGWVWPDPDKPGEGYRHKDYELLDMQLLLPMGAETRMQRALLWQSELKKIGFDLIIREIVWAIAYRVMRAHESDAMITGWGPDYADPDNYVDAILKSPNPDSIYGVSYANPVVDALIVKAKVETDLDKRAELYKEVQEIAFEDAPYVWEAQSVDVTVLNKRVKGYYKNPALQINFAALYFEG